MPLNIREVPLEGQDIGSEGKERDGECLRGVPEFHCEQSCFSPIMFFMLNDCGSSSNQEPAFGPVDSRVLRSVSIDYLSGRQT